jgi:hypothetical protein
MQTEIWMPVEGFEDCYSVSNFGHVRSEAREVFSPLRGRFKVRERILKPQLDGDGYPFVMLGAGNLRKVHLLVARTFIGNPDRLPQVDHEDTDKTNCAQSNLRWCTQAKNAEYRHAKSHKTCVVRFTSEQRAACAAAVQAGRPILHIAREMDMSRHSVRRIADEWINGRKPTAQRKRKPTSPQNPDL